MIIKPSQKEIAKKPKYKKATKIKKLFKKMKGTSKLETTFEEILIDLGVNYVHHYRFGKREFDFCCTDYNLLIEADGDFWHVNEAMGFEVKYPFQKRTIKNDKFKDKLVSKSNDYTLIRFWEEDINNNKSGVILQLINELNRLGKR